MPARPPVRRCCASSAPEYEIDDDRGIVRWRIERGLLVAPRGRGGDGYLEIDVERRLPSDAGARCACTSRSRSRTSTRAIASGSRRWVYANTQSRIHVIVTHGFLRSLARLDLARVARRALRGDHRGATRAATPSHAELARAGRVLVAT